MKTEILAVLMAALAAPGFWELLKSIILAFSGKQKITIEEVGDKLDAQGKKIDSLEKSFDAKSKADEEKEAKAARRRILRADDEIRAGTRHSRDFFLDVLRDIDDYETYCDNHPHFKNKCAESAIRSICECYDRQKLTNDFL